MRPTRTTMSDAELPSRLPHDELAASLAAHLGGERVMTWCDIQLGPSGSVRPDVYTICKSYANPRPMAYECKVSRSDFLADVTTGKWQAYLTYACGVVFACEVGLLTKAEVPTHCGLIVRHESGTWRLAKRPVLSPVIIPQDALIKLLIDGVEREGPRHRAKWWRDDKYMHELKSKFGETVARTIADRMGVEREIESARRTAERIVQDAEATANRIKTEAADLMAPLRTELCEVLGLPADTRHFKIKHEITELRAALAEHPAHEDLRHLTGALQSALERFGYKKPDIGEEAA